MDQVLLETVICASDGAEAVSLAESSPPELILLDAMMPNMDGLEACRKLKANPRTRDIPVIFLSAKSEQEEIRKVLDAGAAVRGWECQQNWRQMMVLNSLDSTVPL